MTLTKVIWINRHGERREHTLGGLFSYTYALDWWRRSILDSQGVFSLDERRNSQLKFLGVKNHLTEPILNFRCLA